MYIRDDLLDKIKEIFKIKEFTYVGIEKNLSGSNFPFFLLFTTDQNLMAIKKNNYEKDVYNIEIIEKNNNYNNYYVCNPKYCSLKVKENETILTKISMFSNTIEHRFPGKAFDFDKEFIIATLENGRGDL